MFVKTISLLLGVMPVWEMSLPPKKTKFIIIMCHYTTGSLLNDCTWISLLSTCKVWVCISEVVSTNSCPHSFKAHFKNTINCCVLSIRWKSCNCGPWVKSYCTTLTCCMKECEELYQLNMILLLWLHCNITGLPEHEPKETPQSFKLDSSEQLSSVMKLLLALLLYWLS